MTAQFSDQVQYKERPFSFAGRKGPPLFDPAEYKLRPISRCTACWRGFLCEYEVCGENLLLRRLNINFEADSIPRPLCGTAPRATRQDQGFHGLFSHAYLFDSRVVPYTGSILLATDFIEELYVHMGFHPAWKFKEVHELKFEQGRIVYERDCSEVMAQIRARKLDRPLEPLNRETIPEWIDDCFNQEYTEFG